jgi:GAF domain-containing protein
MADDALHLELKKERDRTERMLVQLETRTEQMALITGIIKKLLSGMKLDEILNIFGKYVKTICPYDRVDISIINHSTGNVDIPFVLSGGQVLKNPEDYVRPFKATVISKVVEENLPLLRRDIRKDFRFDSDRLFVKQGFASEMIFPLYFGDEVMGTFDIACYEPGRLTEDHLEILKEIMPAFSLALHFHIRNTHCNE